MAKPNFRPACLTFQDPFMVREENQPRLLRANAFIGDVTAGSRQDVTSQSPFILPVLSLPAVQSAVAQSVWQVVQLGVWSDQLPHPSENQNSATPPPSKRWVQSIQYHKTKQWLDPAQGVVQCTGGGQISFPFNCSLQLTVRSDKPCCENVAPLRHSGSLYLSFERCW